jgi:Putative hemolysin
MEEKIFQINLREIIKTKAPAYYKKVPKFLISWLEKIIYQDQLNDFLRYSAGKRGVDMMESAVEYFNITLEIRGEENIPAFEDKCIFASNHPLGGLDGICLSAYLGKRYNKHIRYLVNDLLYFIEPLQDIFVPINKHGSQSKNAVEKLHEAFESDNQIITFPAGLCSRKIKGEIMDLQWKKMFISKAIEYKRDVVPVFFEARNSNFFYNFSAIRRKLGIKFNLDMLFLPREMFKSKGSTFIIHIGKPIPWETFDSSKTQQQWADWTKKVVYNSVKK